MWASTVDVSEGREEREGREGEDERYVSLCLAVTGRGVCMHQMSISMGLRCWRGIRKDGRTERQREENEGEQIFEDMNYCTFLFRRTTNSPFLPPSLSPSFPPDFQTHRQTAKDHISRVARLDGRVPQA